MPDDLRPIVENYRKIIVLVEDETRLEPADQQRAEVVGRILYHENQRRLTDLADELTAGLTASPPAVARLASFLDVVEEHPELRDAAKLVFRDTLAEVAETLRAAPATGTGVTTRVAEDQAALDEIQALSSGAGEGEGLRPVN